MPVLDFRVLSADSEDGFKLEALASVPHATEDKGQRHRHPWVLEKWFDFGLLEVCYERADGVAVLDCLIS